MLVLTRRRYQAVILADEITVTVEDISDQLGQHLFGARVRLGFQCPRHVSIDRSELRARCAGSGRSAAPGRTVTPLEGHVNELFGAQVRLRIEVPRRVPVCLNGAPTAGLEVDLVGPYAPRSPVTWHRLTCRQDDQVSICKNITIAALAFHCFEPASGAGERRPALVVE